jgi:hypothetical protein
MQPPHVQFGGYSQVLQPTVGGAYNYISPAPYAGPPTLVVDTSDIIQQGGQRRTTQRHDRHDRHDRQARQGNTMTAGGEQISTQRITIRKLG